MKKYRIRIETQKDGHKWYRAQECILSFLGIWLNWNYLDITGYRNEWESYLLTLNDAELAIKNRKKLNIETDNKNITKIEHKYL